MKTEVYSWRVSADLKSDLERAARDRRISIADLLDVAAKEWLRNSSHKDDDEAEQQRIREAAAKSFGVLASGDPRGSERVREVVRQRLRRRYGR